HGGVVAGGERRDERCEIRIGREIAREGRKSPRPAHLRERVGRRRRGGGVRVRVGHALACGAAATTLGLGMRWGRATSPCVIARWRSDGVSPGEIMLGVTSLEGNICTNAGAR